MTLFENDDDDEYDGDFIDDDIESPLVRVMLKMEHQGFTKEYRMADVAAASDIEEDFKDNDDEESNKLSQKRRSDKNESGMSASKAALKLSAKANSGHKLKTSK